MPDTTTFLNVTYLLGGLALFLFGMELAVEGLQKSAGFRLRGVMSLLTGNRVLGAVVGAGVTVGLQSSSATTVLLVGLADTGLIALTHTVGVIAGAAIGTTLTVQIIAFNVAEYGLLAVFAGFLMHVLLPGEVWRAVGRLLMGFGFVFFGMHLMKTGAAPLTDLPAFTGLLRNVADRPLLGVLAAAVFTAVVQSSAATLAVAMVIASQSAAGDGVDALALVVPFVLGANIGTCATATLASLRTGRRGKQVAIIHLVVKIAGVAVILPLLGPFARLTEWVTGWMMPGGASSAAVVSRQVANAHTLFALVAAALVLPFARPLARGIARALPVKHKGPKPLGAGLDRDLLEEPERALAAARNEIANAAEAVADMFRLARRAVLEGDRAALRAIANRDEGVDLSHAAVLDYLVQLRPDALDDGLARRRVALFEAARDVEVCGNVIRGPIAEAARTLIDSGASLSVEGTLQLRRFWREVGESFGPSVRALRESDLDAARGVVDRDGQIEARLHELHQAHVWRFAKELAATRRTSTVHVDTLAALRNVHRQLADASRRLLDAADAGDASPEPIDT